MGESPSSPTPSGAETLLLERLGTPYLAFVLNGTESEVRERLSGMSSLEEAQEAVLMELLAFLGTIGRGMADEPAEVVSLRLVQALGALDPSTGHSWSIERRLRLGGAIDVPEPPDPVSTALSSLAIDVYPMLLLPSRDEHRFGYFFFEPLLFPMLIDHPDHEVFVSEVRNEPSLGALFSDDFENPAVVYRSTGAGGGLDLRMFSESLLKNAWFELSLSEPRPPSIAAFVEEAVNQLEMVRRAARGESLEIRVLAAFTGLRLTPGVQIPVPWGTLRELDEHERQLAPQGLEGRMTGADARGEQLTLEYAGDLVLDMTVPYHVLVADDPPPGDGAWPSGLESAEAIERRSETLRLGLLLSRDDAPMLLSTWTIWLDPLAIGSKFMSWRDPRQARSLTPLRLSPSEAQEWSTWVRVVDERRVSSIDVAVRRVLLSATERTDPMDGLVDAVIVWENLVGSSEGESTLRVSSALARLLTDSNDERHEIAREIKRLYKARSRVVHGRPPPEPQAVTQSHREALNIAIRALRAFFEDRPELLSDCADSNARSLALLLEDAAISRNASR